MATHVAIHRKRAYTSDGAWMALYTDRKPKLDLGESIDRWDAIKTSQSIDCSFSQSIVSVEDEGPSGMQQRGQRGREIRALVVHKSVPGGREDREGASVASPVGHKVGIMVVLRLRLSKAVLLIVLRAWERGATNEGEEAAALRQQKRRKICGDDSITPNEINN
ncbi:conserved carboxylase domain protein [Striga asiatica]|uniref:Conserved carboxylase domain protein n=1 Tax=Striga asiatica TaxID=4170 RepID=A0A5A7PJU7_STRAF|nr:conserved carboxylase domain protein [Striga asiatica]